MRHLPFGTLAIFGARANLKICNFQTVEAMTTKFGDFP